MRARNDAGEEALHLGEERLGIPDMGRKVSAGQLRQARARNLLG